MRCQHGFMPIQIVGIKFAALPSSSTVITDTAPVASSSPIPEIPEKEVFGYRMNEAGEWVEQPRPKFWSEMTDEEKAWTAGSLIVGLIIIIGTHNWWF